MLTGEGAEQDVSRRAGTSFLGTETPRKTIATDLGLQGPLLPPYDYLNNVTVDRNDIYVNADRADVIDEF